jgi:hypothetical protein
MIEELLGFDSRNIQPHHDRVMQEMIDYNCDLEYHLLVFNEYEEVSGLNKGEFLINEQELLYTLLGTTTALLYLYNKLEHYELSADLHKEMKRAFLLIMDEIFPKTNNEQKFYDLVEKMFQSYKQITQ